MGFELTGMKDVLKNLEKMGNQSQEVADEALKAGAEVLRAKMEELAPRSTLNKEHLANHIIISAIKDGKLDVGPKQGFFYAHFLEFGTSKISPQPFAQPAFESCKDEIQRVMANVIKSRLKL
ncbi:HK97-gp10 family putative phage morphogenesis protein [Chengkuizengella marina]|uniref:HK97 gp10 family phage protein n=1 Tax=Chengkuizengella marina TaxID=2507566 RepID=A0A6N9Q7A0_9BACL|nr:HK97-gp10 family putative phage morphogenesis protein [Chengkuizengella marina]NBI30737.1 HK97 gp10 family phage protein [Chengkuizengella marina]